MPTLPVDGRICLQTHVESQTISPHLPEIIHPLLAPLYALFDRTEPGANHAHGPNAPRPLSPRKQPRWWPSLPSVPKMLISSFPAL